MAAQSLQELFVEELRDTYDAEKRLTKALPKMARAASSVELRAAFTNHLKETERQVTRLEQVFRACGEKPRGKKCDGMMGIIEEGNNAIEELEKGPVRDAALIAGAQRVEHYEIAAYGTLAYFADMLNDERSKDLLGQTLDEEKAADEKLNEIAKSEVNRDALMGDGASEDEEGYGLMGNVRRAASSMGFGTANERTAGRKRSSSSRGGSTRSRKTSRSRSR
jgi:ferritin-like metal-binding protein YciE